MTQPPAPTVVIADIARETTQTDIQSSLVAIQEILTTLSGKVDALMSEDATVAGEVAAEETDLTSLTLTEARDGLKAKTVSATELTKAHIAAVPSAAIISVTSSLSSASPPSHGRPWRWL